MGPELLLERRTEHAGLDARRARGPIDLEHAVEPREVDRDRACPPVADRRLDPADDARAAAVRDGCRPAGGAPVEHGCDVGFGAGEGDDVGRVREVPAQRANDVAERLAVRVRGAIEWLARAEPRERRRWPHARGRQPQLLEPRRLGDRQLRQLEAGGEDLRDRPTLLWTGALALTTPAPEPTRGRRAAHI